MACALLLGAGCDSGNPRGELGDAEPDGEVLDTSVPPDASAPDTSADAAPPSPDATVADTNPPLAPIDCTFMANDFGAGLRELDTGPGGAPLRFTVRGIPDPALIDRATLHFRSYDADHPGEEGVITVNGMGPFDLPANLAWDNLEGAGELDVRAAIVAGDNAIAFGPGPLPRSFFSIGDVRIDARVRIAECSPPPDPTAVERMIHYRDAIYTNRPTWVIRCDDYAFTASGDEHTATDCDGGYVPGGSRRGTATFRFTDVIESNYEVIIRSRHTENRNPAGALFIVDGVERRISQRSSRDHTDDVWGDAHLGGDVDVVLDSSHEGESDSVISVRLVPL